MLPHELCLCRYGMLGRSSLHWPSCLSPQPARAVALGSRAMPCQALASRSARLGLMVGICIVPWQSRRERQERERNCYSGLVPALKPRSFLSKREKGDGVESPCGFGCELNNFTAPKHQSPARLVGGNHFKKYGYLGRNINLYLTALWLIKMEIALQM